MKLKLVMLALVYAVLSSTNLLHAMEPSDRLSAKSFESDHITGCDEIVKLPPEDSLTVHRWNSVTFRVVDVDSTGDTLNVAHLWTFDRGRLERDTIPPTITFDRLGVFKLVASYSSGREMGRFEWIITVIPPLTIDPDTQIPPTTFGLLSAYPNPFNSTTTLSFTLPRRETTTLKVYDLTGREVATLHSGLTLAGVHRAVWDASNVAAGVYVARLQAGEYEQGVKMVVIK